MQPSDLQGQLSEILTTHSPSELLSALSETLRQQHPDHAVTRWCHVLTYLDLARDEVESSDLSMCSPLTSDHYPSPGGNTR